ncbi:MAG: hypothetical protein WAO98_08855 [Alphaproteobacteria bacterium]
MVRKAAIKAVNAINNQCCALLLLADKRQHALKLRPIFLGRAFRYGINLKHVHVFAFGVGMAVRQLRVRRMPGFLPYVRDTG